MQRPSARGLVPLATLLAGCGGAAGTGGPSATCPIATAPATPHFAADLVPALGASCGAGSSTCHGSPPDGHVSFATGATRAAHDVWLGLVNVVPANAPAGEGWLRVAPGDVAHSWLIAKITEDQPGGSGYGARMPLGAPDLCGPTVDAFARWIAAGATDD